MSFVQPSTVLAIAQSLDVGTVSEEAAKALAPDVEYRLRETVQEAQKFMRHAKRRTLTTDDINQALQLKNVQPLYGFGSKDPARFARAAGHQDLLYVHDPELSFEQAVDKPLPKVPVDVGVIPHWLAIDGVQPATAENTPIQPRKAKRPRAAAPASAVARAKTSPDVSGKAAAAPSAQAAAAAAAGEGQEASLVQAPVKHVLSQELQLYFDKVARVLRATPAGQKPSEHIPGLSTAGAGAPQAEEQSIPALQQQKAVLASLAVDPGLHPLMPYFSQLIAEQGRASLKSLPILHILLQALRSLVGNPSVQVEPYLPQIIPFILTCMVGKRLGANPVEDHWAVRQEGAKVAALICDKYGQPYYQIKPRIIQALNTAFQDSSKPLTTHYGAIVGLTYMGHEAVRTALFPNLATYLGTLQKAIQQSKNQMQKSEGHHCFGVLLHAVGLALRDRIKSKLAPGKQDQQAFQAPASPPREDLQSGEAAQPAAEPTAALQAPAHAAAPQLDNGLLESQQSDPLGPSSDVPMGMDIDGASSSHPLAAKADAGDQSSTGRRGALQQQRKEQSLRAVALHGQGESRQDPPQARKPAGIHSTLRLPSRRDVPHSVEFASPADLKRALTDAWSQDADLGKQSAALYELFGDSILPYVPMLPVIS